MTSTPGRTAEFNRLAEHYLIHETIKLLQEVNLKIAGGETSISEYA